MGEFEERLKSVLKEVKDSNRSIILFIDEIHLVMGAGKSSGAMDAANLLKPMLARGELRLIGATTLDEYREHIEKDGAFSRRFQNVYVKEPNIEDSISILRGLRTHYETFHGVTLLDSAIVSAAKLSDRYINDRFLPDKAIDLIDDACATIRCQLDSVPIEIDSLQRKQNKLKIELAALNKDLKQNSKVLKRKSSTIGRKQDIEKELNEITKKLKPLLLQFEAERSNVEEINNLKKKIIKKKKQLDLKTIKRNGEQIDYYLINELKEVIASCEERLVKLENEEKDKIKNDDKKLIDSIVDVNSIAK